MRAREYAHQSGKVCRTVLAPVSINCRSLLRCFCPTPASYSYMGFDDACGSAPACLIICRGSRRRYATPYEELDVMSFDTSGRYGRRADHQATNAGKRFYSLPIRLRVRRRQSRNLALLTNKLARVAARRTDSSPAYIRRRIERRLPLMHFSPSNAADGRHGPQHTDKCRLDGYQA